MTNRAPWHLWLVGLAATAWNGFAAIDFTATARQYEPYMVNVAAPLKDYIYSLPTWTFLVWGIATWSGLFGALALLSRRAAAVPLLTVSLAGAAGMLVVALLYPAPAGGSSPLFAALIMGVAALLLVYAGWLRLRRVLR